eukprot:8759343-Ditylum_brightwellii.AAC.1
MDNSEPTRELILTTGNESLKGDYSFLQIKAVTQTCDGNKRLKALLAQQKSTHHKTPFIEDRFSVVVGLEDGEQYTDTSDQYCREGLQEIINSKLPQK